MYLHDDTERFKELIVECGKKMRIPRSVIEKDYFVTIFLKHLSEAEPQMVFKGGTCLSKCFGLIDRFSEDIDITMCPNVTKKQRRDMKYHIIDVASALGMKHMNADTVYSRSVYAQHEISYPSNFISRTLRPVLMVETYFRPISLPALIMPASSLLCEYLRNTGSDNVISEFGLEPFDVAVQPLKITFIDKLYAVAVNCLEKKITRQSRHLYDLHMIIPHIEFDKEFFLLLKEIGEYETSGFMNKETSFDPSALKEILRNIISEGAYEKDYEDNTLPLLFEPVPYSDVARSMLSSLDDMETEEGEFLIDEILPMDVRTTSEPSLLILCP